VRSPSRELARNQTGFRRTLYLLSRRVRRYANCDSRHEFIAGKTFRTLAPRPCNASRARLWTRSPRNRRSKQWTIDRAQQKISVATLGRTDVARLTGTHHGKISGRPRPPTPAMCVRLLSGRGRLPFLPPAVVRGRSKIKSPSGTTADHHHRPRDLPDRA